MLTIRYYEIFYCDNLQNKSVALLTPTNPKLSLLDILNSLYLHTFIVSQESNHPFYNGQTPLTSEDNRQEETHQELAYDKDSKYEEEKEQVLKQPHHQNYVAQDERVLTEELDKISAFEEDDKDEKV